MLFDCKNRYAAIPQRKAVCRFPSRLAALGSLTAGLGFSAVGFGFQGPGTSGSSAKTPAEYT